MLVWMPNARTLALLLGCVLSVFLTACATAARNVSLNLPRDSRFAQFLDQRSLLASSPPSTSTLQRTAETRRAINEYLTILQMELQAVTENIANADTIADSSGKNEPYRRKYIAWVANTRKIMEDTAPPVVRYEPYSHLADERGLVRYPNVDLSSEYLRAEQISLEYQQVSVLLSRLE